MEHTAIPDPIGFDDLTKVEQIRYLQALWDRISEQPSEIPVPPAHLDIALARLRAYQADPTRARPAYDLLDRLSREPR